jgi:hypothetical protein
LNSSPGDWKTGRGRGEEEMKGKLNGN